MLPILILFFCNKPFFLIRKFELPNYNYKPKYQIVYYQNNCTI